MDRDRANTRVIARQNDTKIRQPHLGTIALDQPRDAVPATARDLQHWELAGDLSQGNRAAVAQRAASLPGFSAIRFSLRFLKMPVILDRVSQRLPPRGRAGEDFHLAAAVIIDPFDPPLAGYFAILKNLGWL